MGTTFRVVVYTDEGSATKATAAAFARVAALEAVMSDYRADSEIMRACTANDAAPGRSIPVSDDLFAVLTLSAEISRASGGAFDVTVGPLTKLWRISRKTQELPDAKELAAALKLVGHDKVTLDAAAKTMTLAVPGMRLDFGGIGKGFAADEVLKLLKRDFGIASALVAAAGDITCGDAPPGTTGWSVEIAPLRKGGPKRTLTLANASVSTSGDLEQVAVIGGVRYSHVLDPKTGLGLTGRRSVTVIAQTGTTADSATKVASVLPADRALAFVAKLPGAETLIVVQEGDERPECVASSPGFARFLQKPLP
jgi:thiamine biosynthesis lipoprotein